MTKTCRFNVIASGSKGNCTAVSGEKNILLDCGVSLAELRGAGVNLPSLDGVFITHAHADHFNRRTVLHLKKIGVPIFASEGTSKDMGIKATMDCKWAKAFKVNHEGSEPTGFIIRVGDKTIVYMTDTGPIEISFKCDILFIEANYSIYTVNKEIRFKRAVESHLAYEEAKQIVIESNRLHELEEVHFIHISKDHGDPKYYLEDMAKYEEIKAKVEVHQ